MPAVLAEPELTIVDAPEQVKPGGPGGGGPPDFEPGGNGWGGGDDDESWRPSRSGPSAGMLGMLATMVSITALFGTIVIAYVVRSTSRAHWEPVALPSSLWVSTGLILASSACLEAAREAFRALRSGPYARWLVATFFLGLGFIVSQAFALRQLVNQRIYLRQNPHSSLFYIITAAHGMHVMGGMLALFYLICRASLGMNNARAEFRTRHNALSVTTVYWHFLDGLWIALFLLLALWK